LSLDTHVLGPFDEAGQVLGLDDVTTNTEVAGRLLEEGLLGVAALVVADNHFLTSLFDLSAITHDKRSGH
jgi:hypothetical protein